MQIGLFFLISVKIFFLTQPKVLGLNKFQELEKNLFKEIFLPILRKSVTLKAEEKLNKWFIAGI